MLGKLIYLVDIVSVHVFRTNELDLYDHGVYGRFDVTAPFCMCDQFSLIFSYVVIRIILLSFLIIPV